MTDRHTNQPIDHLDRDFLIQHTGSEHPLITITLPTERSGHDTGAASIRLRNLLDTAEKQLADQGVAAEDISTWLTPARDLVADPDFWNQQAEGLVVLIDGEETITARLPEELTERVAVGDDWLFSALTRALGGEQDFHLLALSRNKVRLFQTDGHSLYDLDLGTIPASEEDLYDDYDPQRFRQEAPQSRGGSEVSFHGHTGDGETERAYTERFLREVADGLSKRFTVAEQLPLILGGVENLTDQFREFVNWGHPVLTGTLKGATDTLGTPDILKGLEAPLAEWEEQQKQQLSQDVEDARSGKRFLTAVDDIQQAAEQGQIATLLVPAQSSLKGEAELTDLDRTIGLVLRSSGEVRRVGADQEYDLAAITRW